MLFKYISILLHEISIWYNRKIEHNIWFRNLCLWLQRSEVSCSSWPGHPACGIFAYSVIQVYSRSFRFWGCRGATQGYSSLHRFSIGFRCGDWLGHSRTLKCFLRSHSQLPLLCVWGHCHAGKPSHDPSSMLLLKEGGCWPKSHLTSQKA